ncbi:family 10 glycosylhydrolase [Rufibacter sp. LB8]|uniref:family 10 glycosylhydrolase n=1 Tax=Rufibacter sp. LB8 TaxID=2777781 RepID=UPI00178C67C0|nr:family 10 glycosylhydrolase [Rufibacter sp. LB8]
MKHKLLLFLLLVLFSLAGPKTHAQTQYNREFRGIWVATVDNLDWPSRGASAESQKTALRNILDRIKEANLNVVFFQVRTETDAFYKSSYEPWSRFLTGVQGKDPGYDPLAYAIEEAHKRGLELHAWLNPYRVNYSTSASIVYAENHISKTRPEWIIDINGKKILNPGLPEVRAYVADVVQEVVDNYDIDGIHFDDYFYQYPPDQISNQDQATYALYGGGRSIGDWRRHNINESMRIISEGIKASKPTVRFGISPFGIWKNGTPAGITGMDAYNVIYADPLQWMQAGTVDYITPQLYWRIGGAQDFRKLLEWWADQAFSRGKHLYTGHILNTTNYTSTQVPDQIAITREQRAKNSLGSVHFRSSLLVNNTLSTFTNFKNSVYRLPAIPPTMEWLPEDAPEAPQTVTAVKNGNGSYTFTWSRAANNQHAFKRYVLHSLNAPLTGDPDNLPDGTIRALLGTESITIPAANIPMGITYWAVTELSTSNHQSPLSNVFTLEKLAPAPVVTSPALVESVSSNPSVRFEWQIPANAEGFQYQFARDAQFTDMVETSDALAATVNVKEFTGLQAPNPYFFRVRVKIANAWSEWSTVYRYVVDPLGIADMLDVNQLKVYPNPSEGPVFVDISLKKRAEVQIDLVSTDGQTKMKTISKKYNAGDHTVKLNRNKLAPGVYLLIILVDGERTVQRVILL